MVQITSCLKLAALLFVTDLICKGRGVPIQRRDSADIADKEQILVQGLLTTKKLLVSLSLHHHHNYIIM